MAINDLPTQTDSSKQCLRSYREAASYLVNNERSMSQGNDGPLEPAREQRKSSPCGSPPRQRPTTSTASSSSSRCRSRTPSPPHPSETSTSSSSSSSKTPRSVSPGGTPAASAGAALRTRRQGQDQGTERRRVSWAHALVSSVITRPRTLREDAAALFYSRSDEKRFRREAEEAIWDNDDNDKDEWCESLEEDSLTSLSDDEGPPEAEGHAPLWSSDRARKDYGISKAIVVFGDSTHTYDGGIPGSCAVEAAREAKAMASFSFDDAAFWNGQLTWS